ncbi:hypothetical protein [Pseudomonas putida]|uniref:hypothetical protein n=1 Tax=Pseudomonas putida TaxID=303 RepID=UPI00162A951E|nr:hypothetical protein [Pseudomonas putida]MDD1988152.1 hypothetical protein [Pseudomonas putida]QNG07283.1 hypothetical protein GPM17_01415 [Pseudomonas putida]HDS1061588.1 hypothetical protein [Pseudomonas putida]HDS1793007.1 hypothetical protein [Pseudomonas putida]
MNANNEIIYVKDRVHEIEGKDLPTAIFSFSDPQSLIVALLGSLGFDSVSYDQKNAEYHYYSIVQSQRVDLIVFDTRSRSLSGHAVSDLEAAFCIVKAIEGSLSDAMYFSPDLRKKAVDSVISDAGVDEDFFKKVLANWKAYK